MFPIHLQAIKDSLVHKLDAYFTMHTIRGREFVAKARHQAIRFGPNNLPTAFLHHLLCAAHRILQPAT